MLQNPLQIDTFKITYKAIHSQSFCCHQCMHFNINKSKCRIKKCRHNSKFEIHVPNMKFETIMTKQQFEKI